MEPFQDFIGEVGRWKYYCLILKDFDPLQADKLYQNCTMKQIVESLKAKYHYYDSGEE